MVILVYIYEYTKNHPTVQFRWLNCMVYKSYETKLFKTSMTKSKLSNIKEQVTPFNS